jgi:hypothetical protein
MSVYESELEFEEESELESEWEMEYEGEWEAEEEGEEFLGTIGRVVGGLFGGQGEYEEEYEAVYEGEYESEEFFRRIGGFLRRAAPVLRRVARVAAPIVGTAVGGPIGGALGRAASSVLEGEYEGELEFEYEGEFEYEAEEEAEWEAQAAPATGQQALAEFMATAAAQAESEAEAEAMIGAATAYTISPADRTALLGIIPHINRGAAILTRILRRRAITRPAVRVVPTVVRRTTNVLARRAQAGQPVTRRAAGRVMAAQTRRVLGSPRTCAAAMRRNVRATAAVSRPRPGRPTPPPVIARARPPVRRRPGMPSMR